jgi:uncharacterized spore protein YtfJ
MDEQDTDKLMAPIDGILARMGVEQVYGTPHTEGETTIIPVADVMLCFAYGMGKGTAPATATATSDDEEAPGGSGAGGGAGGRTTPRGYIRIDSKGVTYKPIVDEQRMGIVGMLLAGWIVFWVGKTIRAIAAR